MSEKKNIYQKMAAIQAKAIPIVKNKAAYSYQYADLECIMNALTPELVEQQLLLYSTTDYDKDIMRTILTTIVVNIEAPEEKIESKFYIKEDVVLPSQNVYMVAGSAVTYFRRYAITSMFNLTTDADTDAGGAKPGKAPAGRSVESAGGGEKSVDFIAIFDNMIKKGKTEDVVRKQFETYKEKMSVDQVAAVLELINQISKKND